MDALDSRRYFSQGWTIAGTPRLEASNPENPETAAVLKRTVEALMERGAIVRNLENLGERSLPYKISKHKERHRRGGLPVQLLVLGTYPPRLPL
nr:PREDICTED: 28S ribosomal protein S6, mitochondrial [Haliaeetus albicilla]